MRGVFSDVRFARAIAREALRDKYLRMWLEQFFILSENAQRDSESALPTSRFLEDRSERQRE
eukprot:9482107-Pyramimonas_sp.AAC.1